MLRRALGASIVIALIGSCGAPSLASMTIVDNVVTPGTQSGSFETILPSVVINGETVADGVTMYRRSGVLYAHVDDLKSWHLKVDLSQATVIDGYLCTPLSAAGLSNVAFDPTTLRLTATAAIGSDDTPSVGSLLGQSEPAIAKRTTIHSDVRTAAPALTESYAINVDAGSLRNSAVYGQFDTVYDVGPGQFFTGVAGTEGGSASGLTFDQFQRLDTAYVVDYARHLERLRIGDGQTVPDAAGNPVRFGGIQFGSGFDIDPRFVTFPTPTLRGTAYVPSTVQVYENGLLQYSQPVDPGNFALRNVPLTGQGSATVVVRDSTGAAHVLNEPFVSSSALLKSGLSDFSGSVGFAHIEDGFSENRYGPLMATSNERYGVSNAVTLAGHVESGDGVSESSLEGFGAVPVVGIVGLGVADSFGRGSALLANYALDRRTFGFDADAVSRSKGFELVGDRVSQYVDPDIGLSYDLSAYAYLRGTTLRATVSSLDQAMSGKTTLQILSLDRNIHGNDLSLAYGTTTSDGDVIHDFNVSYAFDIGPTSHVQTDNSIGNSPTQVVDYVSDNRTATSGEQIDARLESDGGVQPYGTVDVLRPLLFGNVEYGATAGTFGATAEGGLSGSIVRFLGRTVALPTIGDAFILVRAGYPNVRVKVNGFDVGRTDAHGDLVTSSIVPLENNIVSLDPNDVPDGVATIASQNVVPPRKGGAIVAFVDSHVGAVTIHLVRGDGGPILAGSIVSGAGGPWPVGDDGLVFLSAIKAGPLPIVVDLGYGRSCSATVRIPADLKTVPDLGKVLCTANPVADAPGGVNTPASRGR